MKPDRSLCQPGARCVLVTKTKCLRDPKGLSLGSVFLCSLILLIIKMLRERLWLMSQFFSFNFSFKFLLLLVHVCSTRWLNSWWGVDMCTQEFLILFMSPSSPSSPTLAPFSLYKNICLSVSHYISLILLFSYVLSFSCRRNRVILKLCDLLYLTLWAQVALIFL